MTDTQIHHHKGGRRRIDLPSAADLAKQIRDTGITVAALAAHHSVSVSTISRKLNDAGYRSDGEPTFQPRTASNRLPKIPINYIRDDARLDGAACAKPVYNPDDWFPETAQQMLTTGARAKNICWTECPVREACLQVRLVVDRAEGLRFGISGGLDKDERLELIESGAA